MRAARRVTLFLIARGRGSRGELHFRIRQSQERPDLHGVRKIQARVAPN